MNEAAEKKEIQTTASELDMPRWSVVSFDVREASGLTYTEAVALLNAKESAGIYGLCIVTDDAASRVKA